MCATRLIDILGRIRQVRELAWPARPGQPLYVLHKWLLARDWTLVRPLVWSHPLLSCRLISLFRSVFGSECVDEILVNGSWSNIDWRPLVLRRLKLLLPGPLFPRCSSKPYALSCDVLLAWLSRAWDVGAYCVDVLSSSSHSHCPTPRPRLSVTARFGWVDIGDRSDVHRWLEVVQNRIYNHQSD